MNDNPATLRTAVRSCHNWLPHHHCSLPLCRGEEAADGKHFDKMQRAWDPPQYSEGTEVIVPNPYLYFPKDAQPADWRRGVGSSLQCSGKYKILRGLGKYWNSWHTSWASSPYFVFGFRLQNCRNAKVQKKDRRTWTLIWILFSLIFVAAIFNVRLSAQLSVLI